MKISVMKNILDPKIKIILKNDILYVFDLEEVEYSGDMILENLSGNSKQNDIVLLNEKTYMVNKTISLDIMNLNDDMKMHNNNTIVIAENDKKFVSLAILKQTTESKVNYSSFLPLINFSRIIAMVYIPFIDSPTEEIELFVNGEFFEDTDTDFTMVSEFDRFNKIKMKATYLESESTSTLKKVLVQLFNKDANNVSQFLAKANQEVYVESDAGLLHRRVYKTDENGECIVKIDTSGLEVGEELTVKVGFKKLSNQDNVTILV